MKIVVNNNSITLTKNDYLASGGEGDIYSKNNLAYKIYQDTSKTIPHGKMQELSVITNNNVIRPKDIIFDQNGKSIGYTMRFVQDTAPLCQLFTKAFKERNNITQTNIQDLVKSFQSLISDIHKAKVCIVDLNELNFLISKSYNEIFAIDTDSYQTPSYKATAIMDSIRDRHSTKFSEETDWFSFGILSFQMFIGIHPFKGKHKQYASLDDRMKHNISVFNNDVNIPKNACYAFDVIPEVYRNWYKAIFDNQKRLPPPISFENHIVNIITNIINSDESLEINLYNKYIGKVLEIYYANGTKILTDQFLYINDHKKISHSNQQPTVCTSPHGSLILAELVNSKLELTDVDTQKKLTCNISGSNIMSYNNSLYIKSLGNVLELSIVDLPNNKIISAKPCAQILENASKFFDGVLIQNLIGSFYVSIFPERGKHCQIKIPEIQGFRILDAKYDLKVLMIIGIKNNIYHRFAFRFSSDFSSYDCREVKDVEYLNINFTVLDNGIVVSIVEGQDIEIFSSKKDSANIKIVKNNIISNSNQLGKIGQKLAFCKDDSVYFAKMK